MPYGEREKSYQAGNSWCNYYRQFLEDSRRFRERDRERKNIVKAAEMPWEDSPHGRLKHVVNEMMDTREYCLDIYQQFLDPGSRSGKHRHLSEEVFYVLEGRGYDLHWDVEFDCHNEYVWDWAREPKKFEWQEGEFVYIPPFTIHQHFNGDPDKPARILVAMSRIVKAIGFDWFDQLENAPGYGGK